MLVPLWFTQAMFNDLRLLGRLRFFEVVKKLFRQVWRQHLPNGLTKQVRPDPLRCALVGDVVIEKLAVSAEDKHEIGVCLKEGSVSDFALPQGFLHCQAVGRLSMGQIQGVVSVTQSDVEGAGCESQGENQIRPVADGVSHEIGGGQSVKDRHQSQRQAHQK